MSRKTRTSGRELSCRMYCIDRALLDDEVWMRNIFLEALRQGGLIIKRLTLDKLAPSGFSATALLGEYYARFDCFPAHDSVAFHICSDSSDERGERVRSYLVEKLNPGEVSNYDGFLGMYPEEES